MFVFVALYLFHLYRFLDVLAKPRLSVKRAVHVEKEVSWTHTLLLTFTSAAQVVP